MQTGKKAVESVKEATANVAASAKSGMDKTKATMQEKVDKMKAKDDYNKAIATERKEGRITEADLHKQQAMSHNAAEKDANAAMAGGATKTSGVSGLTTNNNVAPQYSHSSTGHSTTMPGHRMPASDGHVMDDMTHPVGNANDTTQTTTTHDFRHVGGRTGTGYVD